VIDIGGADQGLAEPGHREKHATIPGSRHQQSMIARQKVAIDNDVHTLTRADRRTNRPSGGLRVNAANRVDPDAGGIDHTTRTNCIGATGLMIDALQPHHPARLVIEASQADTVDQQGAQCGSGASQGDRQTGIVKLAIPILHTAAQPL
jgi:hypothetical protein